MRICFVLTTRGNYAKTKRLIELLREDPKFTVQIVANEKAFTEPDFSINFFVKGGSHDAIGQSSALAALEYSAAFRQLKPDTVVLIADRYEVLSAATVASCMNIPIIHLEGGEVSGSVDEHIRHAITKLSHLHFPATTESARRIEKLGEDPKTIFPVGATSIDLFASTYKKPPYQSPFFLVILHPVSTETAHRGKNTESVIKAVDGIAWGQLDVVWIAPNYDANYFVINEAYARLRQRQNFDCYRQIRFEEFAPILRHCACIIGNSSCGIREASFLGVPCVNIGPRQNGRERAENVIDVDYDTEEIVIAIKKQLNQGSYKPSFLYGNGKASEQIYRILETHTFDIQKKITY